MQNNDPTVRSDFSNAFLFRQGCQGYPADLSRQAEAELRVRRSDSPRPSAPGIPEGQLVPREQWRFVEESRIRVPTDLREGVYELFYVAKDPRVMGLGYAATRDVVSFLRNAAADSDGTPNPLGGPTKVKTALGLGVSSSGMYLRDFIYQGFNADTAGRKVLDGTYIHIPGAHKLFLNYRFAQPNPYSVQHRDRYMPYVGFPFNYGVRANPLVADVAMKGPARDGILKRPATDPLVIHADTSTEYWQFQAGLVSTDGFGRDVALPRNARQYLMSGLQHYASAEQEAVRGSCQQPINPTYQGPVMRALVDALDRWVTRDTPPPPSRRPTVANGGLVEPTRRGTRFPRIPGVAFNGVHNAAGGTRLRPQRVG